MSDIGQDRLDTVQRPLGPALRGSILCAVAGVLLMLLGMITVNRFVFGTMLLCAGFFLGNTLAMFMMWLWQTGRL
jgi:hypothetical protein